LNTSMSAQPDMLLRQHPFLPLLAVFAATRLSLAA